LKKIPFKSLKRAYINTLDKQLKRLSKGEKNAGKAAKKPETP